jgi:hypothetical protein
MARANTVSFEEFETAEPPPRRKRHPIRSLIIVLVVLAVLVGIGYLVAEPLAKSIVEGAVDVGVAKELSIPSSEVHSEVEGGSVLVQLLHHKLKDVHVTIDSFSQGNVSGTAVLTAHGVPLDTKKPVSTVSITVKLNADNVKSLLTNGSTDSPTTVAFVGKDVRAGSSISVLGASLPVSIDLLPSAAGGQLVLTPEAISVGTIHYTADQLAASPIGGITAGLRAPRTECVASALPADLTLKSVAVAGDTLNVTVSGTGVTLSSLGQKGTCPA